MLTILLAINLKENGDDNNRTFLVLVVWPFAGLGGIAKMEENLSQIVNFLRLLNPPHNPVRNATPPLYRYAVVKPPNSILLTLIPLDIRHHLPLLPSFQGDEPETRQKRFYFPPPPP